MDTNQLKLVIEQEVLKALNAESTTLTKNDTRDNRSAKEVRIGVSNRHVHLSPHDLERLFGKNYTLNKFKELSQPGQFAAKEKVTIIGPKGKIKDVRILGPARGKTQIEISLFDGFTLGITPPIRHSGDIADTPGIIIQGPRGRVNIPQGLICAARHIHMHPSDAELFKVQDGQLVSVHVTGVRSVTYHEVLIRVSERYRLEMHVDLDEANAAGLKNGDSGILTS